MDAIDISTYRNVAASGYTGALSLDAGSTNVVKATQNGSVTALGRLFNTSACQRMSRAVLNDFKNSLVKAYGEGTAAMALDHTFTGLYESLWPRNGEKARNITIPKVTADLIRETLKWADQEQINKFNDREMQTQASTRLDELLNQTPLSNQERDDLAAALGHARDILTNKSQLSEMERRQLMRVEAKLADLNAKDLAQPNNRSVRTTVNRWIESGRQALVEQLDKAGIAGENKDRILGAYDAEVRQTLEIRLASVGDNDKSFNFSPFTFTQKELKNLCGSICSLTKTCVKHALANMSRETRPDFKFDKSNFKDLIKQKRHYLTNTDENSWNVINKTFSVKMGGETVSIACRQTPVKQIPGNEDVYGANSPLKGNNCHDTTSSHLLNGYSSSITVNNKTVKCYRSATFSPYGLEDATQRRNAGVNRAVEFVKSIFRDRADLLEKVNHADGDRIEVPFTITSVGLLTPALFTKERGMVADQFAIWDEINRLAQAGDEKLQLTLNGKTVVLKPTVLSFNFGVNSFALGNHLSDGITGWGQVNARNNQALTELLNLANQRLQGNPPPVKAENQAAVRVLIEQITHMKDNPSIYKNDNNEAYKMSSRIALLTDLLDESPAFNCKSGKDRTGVNYTDYAFLATLVALGKPIPEPGAELTFDEQALYRSIMMQNGNLEIQRDNTGFEGYKAVTDMTSTQNRMGGGDNMAAMAGAAELVSK